MLFSDDAKAYDLALDTFAASQGVRDVPGIYHAVRKLAYFSTGERSAAAVMRTGRGACTAKHILLRDLLRRRGEVAEVELVEGDFAAGIPQVSSMTAPLRDMLRNGRVADFHCFVIWQKAGNEVRLDATWPDALATHGFPVNAGWTGSGNTLLAITPDGIARRAEDVINAKAQLLSNLSIDQADKRRQFLTLLSDWIASLT